MRDGMHWDKPWRRYYDDDDDDGKLKPRILLTRMVYYIIIKSGSSLSMSVATVSAIELLVGKNIWKLTLSVILRRRVWMFLDMLDEQKTG